VIQRLKSEKNVICIKGNHERWALERRRRRKDVRSFFEPCNRRLCRWRHRPFARGPCLAAALPGHWEGELEASAWRCGTPDRQRRGGRGEGTTGPELRNRLLEQSHAQILIVGHTHVEFELMWTSLPKILNPSLLRESLHL